MKKLLNTLYISSEQAYLSLDGENIIISIPDKEDTRFPFCNFEEIVCFNYNGITPKLMGALMERNISISFISQSGRLLGKIIGKVKGNVFTRIAQIDRFRDAESKLTLIQNTIASKIFNTRFLLNRSLRDYKDIDFDMKISALITKIDELLVSVYSENDVDILRGLEGEIAKDYFSIFNRLLKNNNFTFNGRSKRPPLDEINACLSFLYTIQANTISSALESSGIDSYIGFFHTQRPGRSSLALDIVEEFRALIDRFVLSIFNLKMLDKSDFIYEIGGAVLLNDEGRRKILKLWQDKKKDDIYHYVLKQKIQIGILPFVQANLMGKYIRGEIGEYTPFLIKQ